MAKYIAFLRAINVSGHRIIKMEHLRQIFADMGYGEVATYIQSGNVIFDTKKAKNETIAKKIETGLLAALGFEVEAIVRTMDELKEISAREPYQHITVDKTVAVYTGFLSGEPKQEAIDILYTYNNDIEECKVIGKEIYYLCYKDKGKTKLTNKVIEQKLKLFSTMRNRNTINTLIEKYG